MSLLERDLRPSDVITRASLENAIAAIATTGGSTNGVLHLLAVAHEAGVELELEDFDRVSSRTPLLADLKPGGRFVAADLYDAGGVALVAKRLLEAGVLNEAEQTVTGRTIGEEAADAEETPGPGGRATARRPAEGDRRARDPARQPRARAAASSRWPATSAPSHRGPARVFECEEDAMAAVTAGADRAPATWS